MKAFLHNNLLYQINTCTHTQNTLHVYCPKLSSEIDFSYTSLIILMQKTKYKKARLLSIIMLIHESLFGEINCHEL